MRGPIPGRWTEIADRAGGFEAWTAENNELSLEQLTSTALHRYYSAVSQLG